MPRDYGKVSHRFWTGDTGKQIRVLGLETRVIATYLVTCGSSNMIGLYYLPLTLVCHETGIPFEEASKALRSLGDIGFAFYDEDEETVFVPHMAREQIGDSLKANDKQRFGVIGLLKDNQRSRFHNEFLEMYREAYKLEDVPSIEAPSKPHRSPIEAPSKPENREQDQEQRTESSSLSARDPSTTTTEHGAREPIKRPTGYSLLFTFGRLRGEILGVQEAPGAGVPKDSNGKASSFAEKLTEAEAEDVEATMRMALTRIRDRADGWADDRNAGTNFGFGSWAAKTGDLRQELHGGAPKLAPKPEQRNIRSGNQKSAWMPPEV